MWFDEMSPRVVKELTKHIIKPLSRIYNHFFFSGIIPNELSSALLTPTYKANDKELFSNYRPQFFHFKNFGKINV